MVRVRKENFLKKVFLSHPITPSILSKTLNLFLRWSRYGVKFYTGRGRRLDDPKLKQFK